MIAVRLSPKIEKRLDALAKATGRSKSFFVREALLDRLEDMEDAYLAAAILKRVRLGTERVYPLDEVDRLRLGLGAQQRPRRGASRASPMPEESFGSGCIRLSFRPSGNAQDAEAPRGSKCSRCGSPMSAHREDVSYDMSGLRGITLEKLMVYRCRTCGAFDVAIPAVEQLHSLLASMLAKKPTPLHPREIRFLRKYLGHSSAELARKLGVRAPTVLGWERLRTPKAMQASVERRIRAMASRRATVKVVTSAWNAQS